MDQRRPSASLRTRRPSTVCAETDDAGQAIPEVPGLPQNHLSPYFENGPSGPPSRPPMRNAKSSETSVDGAGRARSRGGSNAAPMGGDSKVGAYLLNKRQSVSFGRTTAADIRAGVRQQAVPSLPEGYAPIASGQGAPRGYNEAIGRTGGVPGQPIIHPGGARRGAAQETMTAGEELVANAPRGPAGQALTELLKEEFVADAFVKAHLSPAAAANANVQLDDLRKLKAALTHMLNSTQENLQTNVIQNYTEFIKVSKDIAALENEMLELKAVLEEWKTVPEGLEIEQSFDPNANSGRNRRNSLADLQALYKTQLEALWESVEGSQRFLPATPGRHVLSKHSNWVELNNATYRPRQAVHLFLLNDAMLIGIEKRRQMGKSIRIVADKCFHLNEIAVTDLRDQGESLTNAIRIKREREVYIFRTEKVEEKRALLGQFKKILEETMNRKRKESVWEAEARRDTGSLGSSRGASSGQAKHPLAGFKPSAHFSFITSKDTTGKDLSWIDDISDQLAVHIALREYEQAVTVLETAKAVLPKVEADPLAEGLLRSKIDGRTSELCSVLLANLSDTNIRKSGVVKMSGWLLRLGQGERARETFLAGRGELLKSRTGEINFASQGNGSSHADAQTLVNEVAELSFVCFTLIRNTCEWYMAAYKDHQTASAFVRWASAQVEEFSSIFKRQVYGSMAFDANTKQRCVETATAQAAMLKDVGLDFAFLLSTSLQYAPPPLPPRGGDNSDSYSTQPLALNKKKSGELKASALQIGHSSSRPTTPNRPTTPGKAGTPHRPLTPKRSQIRQPPQEAMHQPDWKYLVNWTGDT